MIRFLQLFALLLLAGCATPPRPNVVTRAPPAESPKPAPRATSIPPTAPMLPFRTIVAVQTCLDRNNFSPGCIDGQVTDQFASALRAWQRARKLPVTGTIDDATLTRVGDLNAEFTPHTVTRDEFAALTEAPASWREKAKAHWLGYATIQESIAEKYHMSENALRDLNPGAAWPDPPAGTTLVVPRSLPGRYVEIGTIRISLSRRELTAFDAAGVPVALFPCTIALHEDKRPIGELKIVNAASEPTYTFDPAVFAEDAEAQTMTGKLLIPPGPNNPVGLAWLSLDRPGYGIHGTPRPEEIGQAQSHGCFRLANWNAQKLVKMVKIGTPVMVEP